MSAARRSVIRVAGSSCPLKSILIHQLGDIQGELVPSGYSPGEVCVPSSIDIANYILKRLCFRTSIASMWDKNILGRNHQFVMNDPVTSHQVGIVTSILKSLPVKRRHNVPDAVSTHISASDKSAGTGLDTVQFSFTGDCLGGPNLRSILKLRANIDVIGSFLDVGRTTV